MSWYQVNICSFDKIIQRSRNWSNEDIFRGKYTTWTGLFPENTDSGRLDAFFIIKCDLKFQLHIAITFLSFWKKALVATSHKHCSHHRLFLIMLSSSFWIEGFFILFFWLALPWYYHMGPEVIWLFMFSFQVPFMNVDFNRLLFSRGAWFQHS